MNPWSSILVSFATVAALAAIPVVGVHSAGLEFVFGVAAPYVAIATFLCGMVWRALAWARSAVPFRIPTTCGQQKSLKWIRPARLDNPSSGLAAAARMLLEILFFRSLFRNTRSGLKTPGPRFVQRPARTLWLAGLVFHWSLLFILIRHLRFFLDPAPAAVTWASSLDGLTCFALPAVYLTDAGLVAAASFLFIRRICIPQLRYLSLPADYFPLFLILGIALSGVDLRYFCRTDIVHVKQLALSLATLHPRTPEGLNLVFYAHLFLVCVLLAYFPFSKLAHAAGVLFSPTRNLANNSRARRHVNPWDYPVETHTYEEYEDEFRDKMKAAGLPVEKE